MPTTPFGLLELGSNSLKFYLVDPLRTEDPIVVTEKFPWRIAHHYFSLGTVGTEASEEITACLRQAETFAQGMPLAGMIALATGVFREIRGLPEITDLVKAETGVRIKVISGEDEALLMAKDYRASVGGQSAVLIDLGGATTQWAWFRAGEIERCGSLTLGAIRSACLFASLAGDRVTYLNASSDYCDQKLASLPVRGDVTLVGTGGTVKAAAKTAGSDVVSLDALRIMIERVLREGPPPELKPSRRLVFLPGLIILWRILVRLGADSCTYGHASVKGGMAGRLVRLLGQVKREDLHATLLLHSTRISK